LGFAEWRKEQGKPVPDEPIHPWARIYSSECKETKMKTGGIRGFIRDILIIYVTIRLVAVWLFGAKFDAILGIMVLLLGLSAMWFMFERVFGRK